MTWSLQDAKNRFSELVERVRNEGPQHVTRNGKDAVVVVSAEEWQSIRDRSSTLADFFLSSPLPNSGLEVVRDGSTLRSVDL
ncbi:MAG: type II toxin-antitoxin system Phd/YefM family antitoxin [Rectinemataceae bacterium]|jgi:prevent-host-death family protein